MRALRTGLAVAALGLVVGLVEAGDAGALKGRFGRKLGGEPWIVELDGKGHFTVFMDKEVVVEGKYKVTKDEIEFTDEKGKFASPKEGPGTYRWKLEKEAVTFVKIKDTAEGRSTALQDGPWERQK